MKCSGVLKKLYTELCSGSHASTDCNAHSARGNIVDAWDPSAIAWSTIGILERDYYKPDTGKYDKNYYPLITLLQGTATDHYSDHDLADHARWWGAIWTALADES